MKYLTNSGLSYFLKKIKAYIASQLNSKASVIHTHTKSDITDFPDGLVVDSTLDGTSSNAIANSAVVDALDGKSNTGHTHTKSDITDFPTLATVATSGSYNDLSNKPTTMTPKSHTHGNITNDGKIGSNANKPLITTTKGVITTGSFGTTANTFCEGNDSRLSDARTPTAHTHVKSEITDFPTLSTVATSGSYNDLSNKPTIPTVNNATLKIQKNGTDIKTFTANASSNVTCNITVPTKTSDLTNDSGFLTSHQSLSNYSTLANTVKSLSISGKTITVTPGSGDAYTLTTQDTTYTHPTSSGNKHIPSGGSSGKFLGWDSDGTAKWVNNPNSDTKNTAGSTDTSSKIFLIGATSQAANPQTYSHDTAYVGTDGCLYSGGTKVLTAHQSLSNYSTLANTIKSLSISGRTITYTKGDDSTGTLTTQDNNTWTAMVGATSSANGSVGYVNAVPPKDGYNTKYLRADGTWQVPPDHTYNVYNKTLTIQKNGTNVATFTSNSNTDVTANISVPTKTSQLTNDSGFLTSHQSLSNYSTLANTIKSLSISGKTITYTKGDGTTGTLTTQDTNTTYSNFVKSGSGAKAGLVPAPSTTAGTTKYLREDGTWQVPPDHTYTVNNATLTIQKNGTTVKTFTANASSNVTCNITVPTKVSELTNDSGFLTSVLPIGSYIQFAGTQAPDGFLVCNGGEISRTTYSQLFAVIGTTYGSGDGSTTFNLPNLIGKFLQGDVISGTVKEAGLPNITGRFTPYAEQWTFADGSFYATGTNQPGWGTSDGMDNDNNLMCFDASRSSSIYGNSSTVQPPALTCLICIKY